MPTQDGVYEFAVTVTDGRGGSDISVVRVFVGNADPATCPRADAGIDQTISEGAAVMLRGGNSADSSGAGLTFDWFQVSGPQVSVSGVFTAEPGFAAPQAVGADVLLEFELTVTNEQGCTDTDTVVVTVRDRDANDPCNGVVCDRDGQFCNGVESCINGQCVSSGNPCGANEACDASTDTCTTQSGCSIDADCDDGDACTDDVCNSTTGACVSTHITCPDGMTCMNGTCQLMGCSTDAECDDGNPCTNDSCDAAIGQCQSTPMTCPGGTSCDDGKCINDGTSCAEPVGTGGFAVAKTSIGTTNIALDPAYFVEFDEDIDENTFSADVVQVIEAGPDNILDTPDDVAISPIVTLSSDNKRINVSISPITGVLIAGRRYRVTISPGCMRATIGAFENVEGLDGEFFGTLPSGDGQQGGSFVHEFIGIEQRVFATNTGAMQTLAIRPTDGTLYGVGPEGSFGPITVGANVGNDLAALAELGPGGTDSFGSIFTSDGGTPLVTSPWASGQQGGFSFNLQRVQLSGALPTSERVANSQSSLRFLRRVPAGFSGPTVAPGEIVGTRSNGNMQVLDLSTTPAQERDFGLMRFGGTVVELARAMVRL